MTIQTYHVELPLESDSERYFSVAICTTTEAAGDVVRYLLANPYKPIAVIRISIKEEFIPDKPI